MKSTGAFLVGGAVFVVSAIVVERLRELLSGNAVAKFEWGGALAYGIPSLIAFVVGCCILRWGRDDLNK